MTRARLTAVALGLLAAAPAARAGFVPIDVPGADHTTAFGVSGGTVVGCYSAAGAIHGFVYEGGAFTTLDVPGAAYTQVYGAAGTYLVGSHRPAGEAYGRGFVYDRTTDTFTTLAYPGADGTSGFGIDIDPATGVPTAVGYSFGPAGLRGFRYDGTAYTPLSVPGASATIAFGVAAGRVSGSYTDGGGAHGFVYDGSAYTPIDVPGATETYVYGINGQTVVGYYRTGGGPERPFVSDGTGFTTLDVPGAGNAVAFGTDGTTVVGSYVDLASGATRGFVYTPATAAAPAPAGLGLLASGVAALVGYARARRPGRGKSSGSR